ncbi:hypothetical protein JCM24511_02986 [Saitozyma sp. JCM 24511]|nr:hypothetical protein JCM24511_02986 [Saitozyma sp. JCM 24511]
MVHPTVLRLRGGGNCFSHDQPVDALGAQPQLKEHGQPTSTTPSASAQAPTTNIEGDTQKPLHTTTNPDDSSGTGTGTGTDTLDAKRRNDMYLAMAPPTNQNYMGTGAGVVGGGGGF